MLGRRARGVHSIMLMERRSQDLEVIEEKGSSLDITVGRVEAQPMSELVKSFLKESRNLVRDELHLAKLEVAREAKKAAIGGIAFAAGLGVVFSAFLVLA